MLLKGGDELITKLNILYPNLSLEEIHEVKGAFNRYLLVAWDIYQDLERQRIQREKDVFDFGSGQP